MPQWRAPAAPRGATRGVAVTGGGRNLSPSRQSGPGPAGRARRRSRAPRCPGDRSERFGVEQVAAHREQDLLFSGEVFVDQFHHPRTERAQFVRRGAGRDHLGAVARRPRRSRDAASSAVSRSVTANSLAPARMLRVLRAHHVRRAERAADGALDRGKETSSSRSECAWVGREHVHRLRMSSRDARRAWRRRRRILAHTARRNGSSRRGRSAFRSSEQSGACASLACSRAAAPRDPRGATPATGRRSSGCRPRPATAVIPTDDSRNARRAPRASPGAPPSPPLVRPPVGAGRLRTRASRGPLRQTFRELVRVNLPRHGARGRDRGDEFVGLLLLHRSHERVVSAACTRPHACPRGSVTIAVRCVTWRCTYTRSLPRRARCSSNRVGIGDPVRREPRTVKRLVKVCILPRSTEGPAAARFPPARRTIGTRAEVASAAPNAASRLNAARPPNTRKKKSVIARAGTSSVHP